MVSLLNPSDTPAVYRRYNWPTYLLKLPPELLIMVSEYLGSLCNKWNFALAFPSSPCLMLPLLKSLKVRSKTCDWGKDAAENLTTVLCFLHDWPQCASEIRNVRFHYCQCSTLVRDVTHGTVCPQPSTGRALSKLRSLARSSGLDSNPSFMHCFVTAGHDFELSKLALLLALARNVRNVELVIETKEWCDLGHIAQHALLPAAQVFQMQHRGLRELKLAKGIQSMWKSRYPGRLYPPFSGADLTRVFDRNLANFISTTYLIPGLYNLVLENLTESLCFRGTWPSRAQNLESTSIVNCWTGREFIPRYLRSIRGLQSLAIELNGAMFKESPDGYGAITRGLIPHKDTLRNLKLTLADTRTGVLTNLSAAQPIGTLRFLNCLARLEVSTWILDDHREDNEGLRWYDILPASIHNFVLNWNVETKFANLKLLAVRLKATERQHFPHLTHIIDNRNTLKESVSGTYRVISETMNDLRSVGIIVYPNDENGFGSCAQTSSRRWSPALGYQSPHLECMGECAKTTI